MTAVTRHVELSLHSIRYMFEDVQVSASNGEIEVIDIGVVRAWCDRCDNYHCDRLLYPGPGSRYYERMREHLVEHFIDQVQEIEAECREIEYDPDEDYRGARWV